MITVSVIFENRIHALFHGIKAIRLKLKEPAILSAAIEELNDKYYDEDNN